MEVDVAIVGGGMGGLALAIGLQNRGIRAHVFEKSPKQRKHFGTGMSIGENGMLNSTETQIGSIFSVMLQRQLIVISLVSFESRHSSAGRHQARVE